MATDYKERAEMLERFADSLLNRLAEGIPYSPQVIEDWRACMKRFGNDQKIKP